MSTTVSTASELRDAVAAAGPGSEIVARGGTYDFAGRWNINSRGSQGNRLVIRAADGEQPHIRFAAGQDNPTDDSGIKVTKSYVTVKGFEISRSGYKGIFAAGNAHHTTFEDLDVHHNNQWGVMNNGNDNVVFRNCTSHHNYDHQNEGEHSDGFNMTGPAKNGLIEGCRAWNNGDDGYDFWVSENHTIRDCWAYNNGRGEKGDGNGFKLGTTKSTRGGGHVVHNCVAFGNKVDNAAYSPGSGFWWNGEADNPITVYNCTAWDNGTNFAFRDTAHVLKNNISYQGPNELGDEVVQEANSWNIGISDPGFRSTDNSSDDFLRLSSASPCRDSGVEVDIDRNTTDLGAFPYLETKTAGESTTETTKSAVQTTQVDGAVTLRAADAEMTQTNLETEYTGFNGDGYLNFASSEGATARWPLSVDAGGTYNVTIRFANGADAGRAALVRIGDVVREITFPQTDGWVDWSTIAGTVELPNGAVDMVIETAGEDAGNVDQLRLQPVEADNSSGGSSSEPSGDTPLHGYNMPEPGQTEWHVPINQNFESIDKDVPVADAEGAKSQYDPVEGTLYFATDTGAVYIGDGNQWSHLGNLN